MFKDVHQQAAVVGIIQVMLITNVRFVKTVYIEGWTGVFPHL